MAGINRVEANGEVLLDLTEDTVTPASLRSGFTAHDRNGDLITGEGGGIADIDDDAGIGDTDKVWSADKSAREDALRAPIDSPQLTGTPTAPTAADGTNTTQIATTAFVKSAVDGIKSSPAFTGTPTAPTADISTDSAQIATTEFVHDILDYTIDDESGYEDTDKVWSADKTYSRFNEKADAVPETLEGSIVSFENHFDAPLKDLVVNIKLIQSGEGDPSPDNIRPITGWTGCNVSVTGKNLFDGELLVGYYEYVNSEFVRQSQSSTAYRCFKRFLKAGTYTVSFSVPMFIARYVTPQVTKKNISNVTYYTFTLDSDTEFAFGFRKEDNTDWDSATTIQVETGSIATAYEPYNGNTCSISFGEAGTVYGGSLNVTTGLLTVDKGILISSGGWLISSGGVLYIDNLVPNNSFSHISNYYPCNSNVVITGANAAKTYPKQIVQQHDVYNMTRFAIYDTEYETAEAFNTMLSNNPIQIVYYLATPITYQLTPTEVMTLLDQNNIWANAGNISLTRLYDTKTFVNDFVTDRIATKADVITSTASGPIASFTDGSDLGLADVNAKIEPFQDLHGYDSPWPAGFGKNIWNPEDKMYASINDSGTIEEGTVSVVVYCSVIEGTTYTVSKGTSNRFRYGFSEEIPSIGATLEGFVSNDSATSLTFTVPEGMNYVAVYVTSNNESIVNSVQIEIGSTATDYQPYSNICPITGFTKCNVTKTGKNLYPILVSQDTFSNNAGASQIRNDDGSLTIAMADNRGNSGIYASSSSSSCVFTKIRKVLMYDKNVPFTVSAFIWANQECSVDFSSDVRINLTTTPTRYENHNNFSIQMKSSSFTGVEVYVKDLQIELGNVSTEYEPYKGGVFPFSWEQKVGTVYHGELNVTTGQLIVDHISQNFTSCKSIVTGSEGRGGIARIFVGVKSREGLLLCSHLKTVNYTAEMWNYRTPNSIAFRGRATGNEICIFIKGLGTAANYNAYLSENPIQVVYEPLDPIVYQLTPIQVMTLLGENHIWADTGDVEVTYKADTKLYIDQKIAESQRATRSLLAGIETDMIATKNYVIGDLLIVGDTLYKVTANIANGSAISTETNVVATTVAEQLILLAQA